MTKSEGAIDGVARINDLTKATGAGAGEVCKDGIPRLLYQKLWTKKKNLVFTSSEIERHDPKLLLITWFYYLIKRYLKTVLEFTANQVRRKRISSSFKGKDMVRDEKKRKNVQLQWRFLDAGNVIKSRERK